MPDEYNNRVNDESLEINSIKEELRNDLEKWLSHYPIHADINRKKSFLDDETIEALRSLGYL